jgi:hypothetical protein
MPDGSSDPEDPRHPHDPIPDRLHRGSLCGCRAAVARLSTAAI